MTISAEVDERTLREIHLVAFEPPYSEAGVWSVMTAYNRVNGVYCGEQPDLIGGVLREEWGFDGLVMSDWFGTHSTVRRPRWPGSTSRCPGPSAWLGPTLAAAVRAGEVDESVVDGRCATCCGSWRGSGSSVAAPRSPTRRSPTTPGAGQWRAGWPPRGRSCWSTTACCRSMPVDASRSVAVIGPNAGQLAMGGGSSEVTPAPAAAGGRGAGGTAPGARRSPPKWAAASTGACRPSTCACSRTRRCRSPTSTTRTWTGDPVATEAAHAARVLWIGPPAAGAHGRAGAPCGCRRRSRPTCRAPGDSGSRAPGERCCASTATVVVDNTEPVRGSSFYGAGSEPVEVTIDLAGRSLVRADDRRVATLVLVPDFGRAHRGGAARHRRRVRTGGGAPPPKPTSPWSSSARTGNGSPRATTVPTSRCRAANGSSSRRCSRSTPAPWWWSTRARRSRCPGRLGPGPCS